MTDHKREVYADGSPAYAALLSALPSPADLAATVTADLKSRIPVYGRLPADVLTGEVQQLTAQVIRVLLAALGRQELPPRAVLDVVRSAAARRAEEGVPIEAVIAAYHSGIRLCADLAAASAATDEPHLVLDLHRMLLRYLEVITAEVALGYVTEHVDSVRETSSARQALLSALLDGGDVGELAAQAGVALPGCYLALAFVVGLHVDETSPDIDRSVAAQRKVRRLRSELERHTGQAVLSRISSDQGIALFPWPRRHDELEPADWSWMSGVIDDFGKAAGVDVVAGMAAGDPADMRSTVGLAVEVRDVAVRAGRTHGSYRLTDLLLEYQLTRPGAARELLVELLAPVADRPDLLDTLGVYLESNLNRRQTASRLNVHANTIDYRLRRIAAATGLDTSDHRDLATLTAAVFARRSQRS